MLKDSLGGERNLKYTVASVRLFLDQRQSKSSFYETRYFNRVQDLSLSPNTLYRGAPLCSCLPVLPVHQKAAQSSSSSSLKYAKEKRSKMKSRETKLECDISLQRKLEENDLSEINKTDILNVIGVKTLQFEKIFSVPNSRNNYKT